jgi:hypothetical protein
MLQQSRKGKELRPVTLFKNITRAAFLHRPTFSAIAADASTGWQAALIVTLAAAAHVIGGIRMALEGGWNPMSSIIPSLPWEFALWLGGATAVSVGARKILGIPTNWVSALRVLGFAFVPAVLNIGMTLPMIPWVVEVWRLAIAFVAVRQLLDTTLTKTFGMFSLGVAGALFLAGVAILPIAIVYW